MVRTLREGLQSREAPWKKILTVKSIRGPMGAQFCTRCGSPVQPGSGFCQKCGAPVTSGAAPAAPTGVAAQPQPVYLTPVPPKKRKWVWVVVAVVVVIVIVIIAFLALAFLVVSSTSINVTAINVTSSDNACGTNGQTSLGFTTSSGGAEQYTVSITNSNLVFSCTIASVSATTSGFSLSGANLPLTIPAQGTESVSFTIHCPSGSYNGILTIDFE